ncbi:MAG: hypothetical protein HQM08_16010 [Candidatus Riflebacteria bacterium]|nr:hypothetical protein [Candidatus Riflebacteria bacterium]
MNKIYPIFAFFFIIFSLTTTKTSGDQPVTVEFSADSSSGKEKVLPFPENLVAEGIPQPSLELGFTLQWNL